MPFALEGTSSHVGGRSTTFSSGLLDCLVYHGGRDGRIPSTAALGLVLERRRRKAALVLGNRRGPAIRFQRVQRMGVERRRMGL